MFYLLIIIGISLITVGIYQDKDKIMNSMISKLFKSTELQEINKLKLRIESLEGSLFDANFRAQLNDNTFMSKELESLDISATVKVSEETTKSMNSLENYKLICELENKNHTLNEICGILDMKKGEVLLLKNLYKNFQI